MKAERYIAATICIVAFVLGWLIGSRREVNPSPEVPTEQKADHFARMRENWSKAARGDPHRVADQSPSGSSVTNAPQGSINWVPATKLPPPDPNEPEDPDKFLSRRKMFQDWDYAKRAEHHLAIKQMLVTQARHTPAFTNIVMMCRSNNLPVWAIAAAYLVAWENANQDPRRPEEFRAGYVRMVTLHIGTRFGIYFNERFTQQLADLRPTVPWGDSHQMMVIGEPLMDHLTWDDLPELAQAQN